MNKKEQIGTLVGLDLILSPEHYKEINDLKEENKELKEKLEKAIEKVKDISFEFGVGNMWVAVVLSTTEQGEELLEILGDKE